MQEQIDRDIKTAMLAGDKNKAEALRTIKSSILNEAIALSSRDSGLTYEQVQKVLAREAKKRQEAADLYKTAGETARAQKELNEKAIIDAYLPAQASEDDIKNAVAEEAAKLGDPSLADMGRIIGAVRGRLGPSSDGATIARLVKEALQ